MVMIKIRKEKLKSGIKDIFIDTGKLNPNLDKLYKQFNRRIDKYFNKDLSPKKEFFIEQSCYNCGSKKYFSEFIINNFRHVRCALCGMVYVTPRLKDQVVHDSYNEKNYDFFYKLKLIPAIDYRRNVIAKRKFEQISNYFTKPGKILDIGCGLGELLSIFKEHGWECLGVEFNQFAADFARKKFGLGIIPKSIFDFSYDGKKFDCIMLWGVLEHFTEPQKVLKKVYELLDDNGLLIIEVPSSDSILVRYFEKFGGYIDRIIEGDRHIMLFSVKSFIDMTQKAGFNLIHLQSNGLDIDTLFRLNNQKIEKEFVTKLQDSIDRNLSGDLLRGFLKKLK